MPRRPSWQLALSAALWLLVVFWLVPLAFEEYAPKERYSLVSTAPLFALAIVAAFAILRRDELLKAAWTRHDLVFFVVSFALFAFALAFNASYTIQWGVFGRALGLVAIQVLIALGALSLAAALFGSSVFLRNRSTVIAGFAIGTTFVGLSLLVRQLWPSLSSLVLQSNVGLLGLTGHAVATTSNNGLGLGDFMVTIGEACSGVDSAVLFSGVFLFVLLLDWKKLNLLRLAWLYPLGLLGMFGVNIVRVALLVLIGAFWSPEFALSMFHTNAGWVLFVLYALGFWYVCYPLVLKK